MSENGKRKEGIGTERNGNWEKKTLKNKVENLIQKKRRLGKIKRRSKQRKYINSNINSKKINKLRKKKKRFSYGKSSGMKNLKLFQI